MFTRWNVEETYQYDLTCDLDDIRPDYTFDVSCQGFVFCREMTLRYNKECRTLGGDAQAIISGSIASAYCDVSPSISPEAISNLNIFLLKVFIEFKEIFKR